MSLREFHAGYTPRPQLTPSQWAAVAAFSDAKFQAKDTKIGWFLHHMRNAWVAYHAGASWMVRSQRASIIAALTEAERVQMRENARLRAEVARWRGVALELWMLLDAIDTAEDVAKDDDAWFRRRAHHLHKQRHTRVSSDDTAWEVDGRDWSKFDALSREDANTDE